MAASQSSRAEPFAGRLTGSRFLAAGPRAAGFLGVDGMRAGDSSTLLGETLRWLNSVLEARVETLAIRRLPNLVQKATSKPRLQLSSLELRCRSRGDELAACALCQGAGKTTARGNER